MSILAAMVAALNAVHISISDQSLTDVGASPSFVSYSLQSDGDIETVSGVGTLNLVDWITPVSKAPGAYEVRATLSLGDTPTGTLGSWVALSSTRTWSLTQTGPGVKSCELFIEIRLGLVILDSATITLSAEVF